MPVLRVDRPGAGTAILTFNRPEKRNALNIELMEAICSALSSLAAEADQRVAILRGEGGTFCAGLDLLEASDEERVERSAQCVASVLRELSSSPLVTIAAVHGAAYAGGAGVMCACDFAVASENSRISFPEVRRGLIPAFVSTVLRDRVGDAALRELLLLAEPIDAQQALRWGLVHRVVKEDDVMDEALRLASIIQQGAPEAIRATKRLLHAIRGARSADLLQTAMEYHALGRNSAEAREGLQAFYERRAPKW
jgi:methylglutaconyl-CoA hydratase